MATATGSRPEVEPPIIELPEYYEVVDGVIVEETPLGAQEGWLAALLGQALGFYAMKHRLGRVVPEVLFVIDAGRKLRRRPDIAFVSRERWPWNRPVPRDVAWDVVPDLAVEITSPSDLIDDLMDKVEEYFAAGVRFLWVVYPKHGRVYAYDSPTSVRILRVGDELDGGPVLPGFRFPISGLFETPEDGPSPEA